MMGLIGTALGAIGSIYGGIKASQAMKQVRNNIQQQQQENQDWYNRRYNEDATQRADAMRMLQMTSDAIKRRNRAAAGTQAVMGGTTEAVAAEKEANAGALANATSQIAAAAEQRKDNIENQFLQNKQALNGQLNQMEANRANAIAEAAKGLGSAAGNLDLGEVNMFGKKVSL